MYKATHGSKTSNTEYVAPIIAKSDFFTTTPDPCDIFEVSAKRCLRIGSGQLIALQILIFTSLD